MADVKKQLEYSEATQTLVGQQDHIPLAPRQLRYGVSQKIAGHDYRETLYFKDMLIHEILVPCGGLLQLGSCQFAQGLLLVSAAGAFTLNISCLVFQNRGAKSAKLILNTMLIGVFHFLTSLRARRCGVVTFLPFASVMQRWRNQQPLMEKNFYESLCYVIETSIKRKKRPSAKCGRAHRIY